MEEKLFRAFAQLLLEPRVDQWGNTVASPIKEAIDSWATSKRTDIAEEIVKKLNIEEFAEKVSKQVEKNLLEKNGSRLE